MARLQFALPARRVIEAYQAMFSGRGGQDDADLVLADLEAFAGLWEVTTADTPDNETKFAEGQRSVLARIQALTRVSEAVLDKLDAVKREQESE